MMTVTGRFAPSPTGQLHTGSLVAAVGSWLMAKSSGGRWLLRIDDLDSQRTIPGMADDIMRTLELFGLLWDGEVSWQSRQTEAYLQAFEELQRLGVVYPCCCSRKEIERSSSAPHPDDDCILYTGACSAGMRPGSEVRSWRVRVDDGETCFDDLRKGRLCHRLRERCGDFVIRQGNGGFAYQLAVVVDDHLTGVNQVVRGDDLLSSTPRQVYLRSLLALPQPVYCHLPLVTGPGGAKLSKRDNLVSHSLNNRKGGETELLAAVLRFLGLSPPVEMKGAGCSELLEWGARQFDFRNMPENGRPLFSIVPSLEHS